MRRNVLALLGAAIVVAVSGCGAPATNLQALDKAAASEVTAASELQKQQAQDAFARALIAKADQDAKAAADAVAKAAAINRKKAQDEARARTQAASKASRSSSGPRVAPVVVDGDMRSRILYCIRSYEGAYTTNTGNGYYGAYQFNLKTWPGAVSRAGYPEYANQLPSNAPPAVQDAAAWQLYQERGLGPWPTPNRNCHPPNPRPKR